MFNGRSDVILPHKKFTLILGVYIPIIPYTPRRYAHVGIRLKTRIFHYSVIQMYNQDHKYSPAVS